MFLWRRIGHKDWLCLRDVDAVAKARGRPALVSAITGITPSLHALCCAGPTGPAGNDRETALAVRLVADFSFGLRPASSMLLLCCPFSVAPIPDLRDVVKVRNSRSFRPFPPTGRVCHFRSFCAQVRRRAPNGTKAGSMYVSLVSLC
jgi:hypothetical protein